MSVLTQKEVVDVDADVDVDTVRDVSYDDPSEEPISLGNIQAFSCSHVVGG
eukprot:CAMPEP_0115028798 /NCGR_PEP_ID=MMETSP0216-20121206/36564_1 /TAXON_ID=223996 /ORGANISM="Protocruzia adherens, Strain Boccale" /LENGTH=50 /DNA_ID=CAMNT_0002405149 /DNA_START=1476 /DNA_END=1629 /DNA_ORIENTATION=+